jgi:glucans biosynthesis protein C
MANTRPQRLYYLDALRASLMLLGVVLHAAIVYITEDANIRVSDADTSAVFDYLILVIHTFRMPAFFLISGFLLALVLERKPGPQILRVRIRRLLIPLISAGLLFNLPEISALHWLGPEFGNVQLQQVSCSTFAALLAGCWLGHLWFLAVLLYFTLLAIVVHKALQKLALIDKMTMPGPASNTWIFVVMLFALGCYVFLGLARRSGLSATLDLFPLLPTENFFRYLPFFFFGFLIQRFKFGLRDWNRLSMVSIASLAICWTLLLTRYYAQDLTIGEALYESRAGLFLYYATALQTTALLFIVAAKIFRPSPAFSSYLSDMSYSVYLAHHLAVIAAAIWISTISATPVFKFMAVLVIATFVSFLFHHFLVRKSDILGFLFNGRMPAIPRRAT